MISTHLKPSSVPHVQVPALWGMQRPARLLSRIMLWVCLILACSGTSWFSYQYFLVPQPRSFAPDWQNAAWIQAADASNPVAYFRLATYFSTLPGSAFVTVAANQVFTLYVNGYDIGTNAGSFVEGDAARAYMFDISTAVQSGTNVVGLRVTNVDNQIPQVRANVGAIWGKTLRFFGTSSNWQGTGQSALVHSRYTTASSAWSKPTFDATQWMPARLATSLPPSASVLVNPLVYEQPMPSYWLSAGASQEAYFVHQVSLPAGFDQALLRIVAAGDAEIFINGHLTMKWVSQVAVPKQSIDEDLGENTTPVSYRKGLLLGVYDITPYVHAGNNVIAVRVLSPGTDTSQVGLATQQGAMSGDMLLNVAGRTQALLDANIGWHASTRPANNWALAGSSALSWATPISIGRPGQVSLFYLPLSTTTYNTQFMPAVLLAQVILGSIAAVLIFWLVFAMVILRRYTYSKREALEMSSLVFLPALACEALLLTLAREPLISRPFPYTTLWASFLLALVACCSLLLCLSIRKRYHLQIIHASSVRPDLPYPTTNTAAGTDWARPPFSLPGSTDSTTLFHKILWILFPERRAAINRALRLVKERLVKGRLVKGRLVKGRLVREHWVLLPVMLLAVPMICYNPGYEPYWQDELSSYEAARGILAHGIPIFFSGMLYPKGEFFSYLMALLIALFGSGQIVPRLLSIGEYIASIPLIYAIGYSLFKKRSIAWLAAAMLAFSPDALLWGRQARMYEQALVMVLLTMFMFCRALWLRQYARPVYLAVLCLILTYLSHEESFIILPAIVICVLLGSREGPAGIPAVLRRKHWWFACFIGAGVIGTQLMIVHFFHPILLGTDQSMRPQIQLTMDNIAYYFHLLFMPQMVRETAASWSNVQPWIVVNSLLAVVGGLWAWRSRDRQARFCALFLLLAALTLIFLFTMQADRYFYPLLGVYYLLGAYGLYKLLRIVWLFARPHMVLRRPTWPENVDSKEHALSQPVVVVARALAAMICISVLLLPILPVSNYNLFVSRALGVSYHRHYPDYDDASAYIRSHWQKGDIVITIAPAISILYYVGQADYYFSLNRALFIIDHNGQLAETTSNAHPLLDQADFQAVLAAHSRIWLISDNGSYQAGIVGSARFQFPPPDFRLVYEGYGSAVFFRSSLP
jgi:hypothetical protein